MSKFCFKCKLAIEPNQRRVIIEDRESDKGDTLSKVFFHKECWHEHQTMKEEQRDVFGLAKGFLLSANKELGLEKEEVIKI